MLSIDDALFAAWESVRPTLLADRVALAKRLERRSSANLLRPPRAMCLAVRASDTRITNASAAIVPEHAVQLNSREHPDHYVEHSVMLDARLIRRLCCPVSIPAPGEPWDEVAHRLGTHPLSL